jgi:hypothetical protein
MFVCDIGAVGATVHALHAAVHLGLVGIVTAGGAAFLLLGARARRRAREGSGG